MPVYDRGRTIHEYQWFTGTGDALTWLSRIYRLDRTRDQDVSLYLGVEKAGMVIQLQSMVRRPRRAGAGPRRVRLADVHR